MFSVDGTGMGRMQARTAGGDVAAAQGLFTLCADEVEASKVVTLAQRVLSAIGAFDREELGGDYDITVLTTCELELQPYRAEIERIPGI